MTVNKNDNRGETFIEVGHYQTTKHLQHAEGDVFLSKKMQSDGRVITVLSDGLGSGIKAGVLATLTATMAIEFIASEIPIKRAAEIIMNTLPVCKERGISYATFTLVNIEPNSKVKIIEYDNPPFVLIRQATIVEPIKEVISVVRKNKETAPKKEAVLQYCTYDVKPGDRLIFFSDGVTQAGMGTPLNPFGWGSPNVQSYILEEIKDEPTISARDLARSIVKKALSFDAYEAKDDITCGVIYFRNPRDMLVLTGPPIHKENDREYAKRFLDFKGQKIVCGGTTATIISRELNRKIKVNMRNIDPRVPPESEMEGADMITEGIITMGTVSEILENGAQTEKLRSNPATKMVDMFLNSDRIFFAVGTKINEAHQDPNMPVELEIRRNIVKKVASLLQEKYLKEVHIEYF